MEKDLEPSQNILSVTLHISGTMHHQRIIQEFYFGISHERHLVMQTLQLGGLGEGVL